MPCSSQTPRWFAKSSQFTPALFQCLPSYFTKPNPSTTEPPPLPTPKPHQALPANLIPALQQRRYIHIERTIHLRVRKQLVDGLQRRRKRVRRRPRRLQEVETDFTRFEIHVWVADWGRESDFGWCERVGGRDEEVPETGWEGWSVGRLEERWFCLIFRTITFVSSPRDALQDGFPV